MQHSQQWRLHTDSLYFTDDYMNVTVHRTGHDGTLKELLRTNGGPWGVSSVETVVNTWLADVFGQDTINKWKENDLQLYHMFWENIKVQGRDLSYNKTNRKTFFIGLLAKYLPTGVHDITTPFTRLNLKDNVEIYKDKLRVPAQIVRSWFDEPINKGIRHISAVLAMPVMNDVDTILLVGEFAECLLVQETIKEAFRNKRIVIPREPRDAVLKGAVLFGHQSRLMGKNQFDS